MNGRLHNDLKDADVEQGNKNTVSSLPVTPNFSLHPQSDLDFCKTIAVPANARFAEEARGCFWEDGDEEIKWTSIYEIRTIFSLQ
ncbi:unnamed protein product [Cylicostephanus goldi]|uniref:Uncharacterized protein n=1 Tax=Cylicostephanus goldi TaxID=71465 RepID=A0A3P6S1Z4_CYLGO|nr:unnamed protein product [Cylicostephanus goldi]